MFKSTLLSIQDFFKILPAHEVQILESLIQIFFLISSDFNVHDLSSKKSGLDGHYKDIKPT